MPRKPASSTVKAAADRAEARAAGKPLDTPKAQIDPPIVSAAAIITEKDRAKAKMGRKTLYTPTLGDLICTYLETGMTLRAVCRLDDIPVSPSTVRRWASDPKHPLSAQYARAREAGYQSMADELTEIADAESTDAGQVARDRLRVDTRKWLLSKALPKIYGDKVINELTGKDGGPVEFSELTDIEKARRIAFALGKVYHRMSEAEVPQSEPSKDRVH